MTRFSINTVSFLVGDIKKLGNLKSLRYDTNSSEYQTYGNRNQ